MRLREKLNNQYFGKIYRAGGKNQANKTLKNMGIKNNSNVVV